MASPFKALAMLAVLLAVPLPAHAAEEHFPSRPIRLICPYPPGGSTDPTARLVASWFTEKLRQQVVVDNRPGAGSTIGHGIAAKATPDGYTILLGTSGGLVTGPAFNPNVPYNPQKDFTPIGLVVYTPFVLATHPSLPAANLKEFLAYAKANPGKISFASPGVGTPNHLGIELLGSMAGVKFLHVPYKGGGPAMVDLLAGRAQAIFAGIPYSITHIRAGRLKAIAIGNPTRVQLLPEAEPIADTLPGFNNTTWYAILGPAGMPESVVKILNAEIAKAVADPEFNKKLVNIGVDPATSTPQELGDKIRSEYARWSKVIKDAGIAPSR